MTVSKGYMIFTADEPLVTDMRPHPDSAPQDAPLCFDAEGWAECYNVYETLEQARIAIKDDMEDIRQSVEDGDLDDYADCEAFALPVAVADDGSITIYEEDGETVLARYKMEDMFTSFGMTPPGQEPDSTPSIM